MAVQYEEYFKEAAEKYGVDESLLKAVAKTESNFNAKAVSGAGAVGVMQLMPSTASWLGVADRYDPHDNIDGGAKYLAYLNDYYSGDQKKVLAAYNTGPGTVDRQGITDSGSRYISKVESNLSDFQAGNVTYEHSSGSFANSSGLNDVKVLGYEVFAENAVGWWFVKIIIILILALLTILFIYKAVGGSPAGIVNKATGGLAGKAGKLVKGD